jgi:pleiotropic regulator 1
MSFNEEVTKHSVHTLVFRSQKRTHDMFIADQGILPAPDAVAFKMWRNIKAKAAYRHIVDRVDKAKRDREAHMNIYGESLPQEGSGEPGDGSESRGGGGELLPYQPQSGFGSGAPAGSITIGSTVS